MTTTVKKLHHITWTAKDYTKFIGEDRNIIGATWVVDMDIDGVLYTNMGYSASYTESESRAFMTMLGLDPAIVLPIRLVGVLKDPTQPPGANNQITITRAVPVTEAKTVEIFEHLEKSLIRDTVEAFAAFGSFIPDPIIPEPEIVDPAAPSL